MLAKLSYYWLYRENNYVLSARQFDKKVSLALEWFDQTNPYQLWMVHPVSHTAYEIVNCGTDFVLEENDGKVLLTQGKAKQSQCFTFKNCEDKERDLDYWFTPATKDHSFLSYNGTVVCQAMDPVDPKTKWTVRKASNSPIIKQSCLIQFQFSGQVMDVPRASDKPRQTICQYPLNGRFNQRWKIRRFENSSFIVTISNLKSKHYLQINDGKDKEGISICQEEYTGDAAQLWILQEHGKRLYLIRSILNRQLVMGVKNRNLKQGMQIVTCKSESKNVWRIVGCVPE